ncbi:hypothetical protein [Halostagnicola sp. A-GB9-2]|uniref:hypothetical protein n=1 Tax=Halostagnicola sp. A-GB9-2 TaxID=3048066 RepID=UPI0024BF4F73|nr:hypothetical protein [Halostagnicola sp. A-GB9-2]MDJ1432366.1 hypothetical protein [Halostagnicola sp. A-GB9-2]
MNPRIKSAVLWGAVGVMAFLVLIQGYALARGPLLSITQAVPVAVLVGCGTTALTYALEYRVAEWSAARAGE